MYFANSTDYSSKSDNIDTRRREGLETVHVSAYYKATAA